MSRDEQGAQNAGHRHARLERLMYEELDALFRTEISDPVLAALRVVTVELSPDLRNARVMFAHPAPAEAEAALSRAMAFLRFRLVEQLQTKRAPLLRFEHHPLAEVSEETELSGES